MKTIKIIILLILSPFCLKAQDAKNLILGGKPIEYKINNTRNYLFKVKLIKNTSYEIDVVQKGIDFVVFLKDKYKKTIIKQDGDNGAWGSEVIEYKSNKNQELFVEIKPLNQDSLINGKFKISFVKKKEVIRIKPIVAFLTPNQMKKDLIVFREIREKANSGFDRYRTKKQLDSIYDWAFSQIKTKKNSIEFYKIIIKLTHFEGSCHNSTSLSYPDADFFPKSKGYFPLRLKLIEDNMIVNSVNSVIPIGSKIISVNGINYKDLMKSFCKYSTSDGYNKTLEKLESVERSFGGIFLLEYGSRENFVIKFIKPNTEKEVTSILKSISLDERIGLNFHSKPYDDLINSIEKGKYNYKTIDKSTALLTIRSFAIGGSATDAEHLKYVKFLDSIFLNMKQNIAIENLIIDIRNNHGGSDPNDIKTFTYLANKPFKENSQAFINFVKIPLPHFFLFDDTDKDIQQIQQNIFEKELKEEFSILKDNKFYQNEKANPFWYPDINSFKGKIYVLINENVASAASLFASLIKGNTDAKFIGEETTGGYYGHNGHTPIKYNLPNSKIKTRFFLVNLNQFVEEKDSQPFGRGIIPDFKINQTFEDFMNNRDTQMEYVLKLIKK